MKKIYFGGKFNLIKNKNLLLNEKLEKDYRSILLGDSNLLTLANNNVKLKNYPILYKGPFYCEQASNGDYTSNSCEVVVTEELKSIVDSDIFVCIFDFNFSVGTITELIEAAHNKKRIVVFYKNESNDYDIKSEYWFAITRAKQICENNNTKIEIFNYYDDYLPLLNNYLINLTYKKRYVSTRENYLNLYLKNCTFIDTYKFLDKTVNIYNIKDNNFVVEKYANDLTIIKSINKLDIKGLVDVTSNPLYQDESINNVKVSKAILEGTDGVGKTTVIENLIKKGIVCQDRSEVICKYMLFDIPMKKRIKAYQKYLEEISPNYVIFLINDSKEELEKRINSRKVISEFDKLAYEYNLLYKDTYNEFKKYDNSNKLELIDCTNLSIEEQYNKIEKFILKEEQ